MDSPRIGLSASSDGGKAVFHHELLKAVRNVAPGIADEIAAVIDDPDPEAGNKWLRAHGFHVPGDEPSPG